MNKKAVIMFSEDAFHLGYMGATQRIIHIANAFRSLKYEVVLVCGRYTNYDKQSEIDDKFNGTVIRTSHSGNYPQLIETSAFTKRIWRLVWKNIGEEYYWKAVGKGRKDGAHDFEVANFLKKHNYDFKLINFGRDGP